MTERTTITLEPANMAFLNQAANGNRSSFINQLLRKERKRKLRELVMLQNIEEAADKEYQAEYALWEVTLMDGIEDE